MKANTIEQYHLLQFVKEHFVAGIIQTEILAKNKIKITDANGSQGILTYKKNEAIIFKTTNGDEQ